MNLIYKILFFILILFTTQCANYESVKQDQEIDKKYYSSVGFALIYDDSLFDQGILDRKIDNDKMESKCKWSPFHGVEIKGFPVITIDNGEIKMKNGEIIGKPGGKLLNF